LEYLNRRSAAIIRGVSPVFDRNHRPLAFGFGESDCEAAADYDKDYDAINVAL
tara:strand:- start:681 stop:839 length:159 start_codon:yes stop_codon:yes gene_type:complete